MAPYCVGLQVYTVVSIFQLPCMGYDIGISAKYCTYVIILICALKKCWVGWQERRNRRIHGWLVNLGICPDDDGCEMWITARS